ncbi:MAG TPA: M1 family metallopeptidase [Fimbriimonadaceae bacterium]|nr:M1 family metallopeptidase [Fimbriimonadaceae bacterium]
MPQLRSLFFAALTLGWTSALADRQEPHNYDLQDVNWHLSYNADTRTIHGDVVNTITVKDRRAYSVWFDCGPLTIERVEVDGRKTTCDLEHERLNVNLPSPAHNGQKLKVRIVYSGSPTAGVYFVDAEHAYPAKVGMVYTQGEAEDNRYWLPTYDFPDDKATAECTIDVPPGRFALSNGKLLGIDKKKDRWTYHWKIAEPISTYLISFVAGDYSEGRESLGSLPVLWYVPRGTERWGAAAFAGTNKMIDLYDHLTGFNYPFEKFSQSAVADFMFGGMENASCVTQTINALHKPENEPLANSEGLVAHELAHQWFGDTVTCADWSQAWLNEGFASFMPSFWFRKSRGQDEFDAQRYGTFQGALASQAATKRPVVSNRYEVPMDLFDGQIYGGGAARLFTLMGQIGEKTFWRGVKEYLNEYKFKNVTTEKFFDVMSRVSKRDLSTFRDQYFHSADVPEYHVSRDGPNVLIKQAAPGYDLDLNVSFLGMDDIEKELPVHVHGPETVVHAPGLEGDVAVLDYPVTSMVRIVYDGTFSSQDLLRIYRLAPNAAGKLAAIARFGTEISDADLLDVARSEKSRPVLIELVGKLKQNAVPFLVQLTHGFDREVANAAVEALGRFPDDPQAADRLAEVWTRDSNEMIRHTALEGLLNAAKDDKWAKSAWQTDSQYDMFRSSALQWWAANDQKVGREKCLEVLAGPPNEPLKTAAIRQLAVLHDAPGEHVVFDILMKLAAGHSYGTRMAAVSALAAYGDPKAISVIEPLTKSSLFFTHRAAEGAIAQLKKKPEGG